MRKTTTEEKKIKIENQAKIKVEKETEIEIGIESTRSVKFYRAC